MRLILGGIGGLLNENFCLPAILLTKLVVFFCVSQLQRVTGDQNARTSQIVFGGG